MNVLDGVELQRSELRAFRESMRADFAEFRTEIERQLAAMRHELATLHASLRQDMTASNAAHAERIAGVEARLMKWSLMFWTGAVLAIAGLVIAMR